MDGLSPAHYWGRFGIECITVTRHMTFLAGNTVKYVWRHQDKDDPFKDLGKALVYLGWLCDLGSGGVFVSGEGRGVAQDLVLTHVVPRLSDMSAAYSAIPLIVFGHTVDAARLIEVERDRYGV